MRPVFRPTPKAKAQTQAQKHFDRAEPDWGKFEKNLKLKSFQQAIVGHPQADAKLKTYVENYGGYLLSKQVTGTVLGDSGKTYTVKELPGGRMGCNCGNWQYRKSVDGGDCKHIRSIVETKPMQKLSSEFMVRRGRSAAAKLVGEAILGKPEAIEKKSDMVKLSMAKEALLADVINSGSNFAMQRRKLRKGLEFNSSASAANEAFKMRPSVGE